MRYDIEPTGFDMLAKTLIDLDFAKTVKPVVTKAGVSMKAKMRADAPEGDHIKRYKYTINYDMSDGGKTVTVGPRDYPEKTNEDGEVTKGRGQGLLSAILEYGQGSNAPHPHIIKQLEPEAEVATEWAVRVIMEALGK